MSPFSRGLRVFHKILYNQPGTGERERGWRISQGEVGGPAWRGWDFSLLVPSSLKGGWESQSTHVFRRKNKQVEWMHSIVSLSWDRGTGKQKMSWMQLIKFLVTFLECNREYRLFLLISWKKVGSVDLYLEKLVILDGPTFCLPDDAL